MNWQWTSIDSISDISSSEITNLVALNSQSSPFLSYTFLHTLESTGCVGEDSGWQVNHLAITDEHGLVAFIPAYLKTHSYGEYVFDHSWAHAYQQHGLDYYPKLSMCIPFTPITGAKVLLREGVSSLQLNKYLSSRKTELMTSLGVSSLHILFIEHSYSNALTEIGMHQRQSVQFNWYNKQYSTFDDFMTNLTARRRRSIKKERKGIAKQGTCVVRLTGTQISAEHMAFFHECYRQTYLKRSGHSGYLNAQFFEQLRQVMSNHLMLVLAEKSGELIAGALFLYDDKGLYGRYWGALQDVSGLHFEACYYQGIEFCIEQNIPLFNPGTQGEHKILRGFEPTMCYSNHALLAPDFDSAVADFLQREAPHIIDYHKQSSSLLPFKQEETN